MNLIKWYSETSFHQWWVDNVWKPSWTKLTTAVYGIPMALITIGDAAYKFASDTTIGSFLDKMAVPNWVPMVLAGIALIHYVASGHDD